MDARTPSDRPRDRPRGRTRGQRRRPRPPLLRATDEARRLIRRAQLALAAAALAAAVPVGIIVTEQQSAEPAPAVVATMQTVPASTADRPRTTGGSVGELARIEAVATHVEAERSPSDPVASGLLAGLTTLLVCWGVLAVVGWVWRARLAALDRLDWTTGWARVEPRWSGRTD